MIYTMTIGSLRQERDILVDLIFDATATELDGGTVDSFYWAELWIQLEKIEWLLAKRMELVV